MNIKHEVNTLMTDYERLHEHVIDLGHRIIERGDWALAAQDRIKKLEDRIAALERRIDLGWHDVTDLYEEPDAPDMYGLVADSIESDPSPESPPPVPRKEDYKECAYFFLTHPETNQNNGGNARIFEHSQFCAKHHTLSRRDSEMLKYMLDLFLRTCPAANECAEGENLIKRLLATMPKEEQS